MRVDKTDSQEENGILPVIGELYDGVVLKPASPRLNVNKIKYVCDFVSDPLANPIVLVRTYDCHGKEYPHNIALLPPLKDQVTFECDSQNSGWLSISKDKEVLVRVYGEIPKKVKYSDEPYLVNFFGCLLYCSESLSPVSNHKNGANGKTIRHLSIEDVIQRRCKENQQLTYEEIIALQKIFHTQASADPEYAKKLKIWSEGSFREFLGRHINPEDEIQHIIGRRRADIEEYARECARSSRLTTQEIIDFLEQGDDTSEAEEDIEVNAEQESRGKLGLRDSPLISDKTYKELLRIGNSLAVDELIPALKERFDRHSLSRK